MNIFIKIFKLLWHNIIYFLILNFGYNFFCMGIFKYSLFESYFTFIIFIILMNFLNTYNDPKNPNKFDDFWKFDYQSKPGHFWAVGVSSNPTDPPIFLDPYKEHFSVGKYCLTCPSNSDVNIQRIPSKPNMGVLQ